MRNAARMRRGRSPGETCHCQIETAPEKMHRTAFAAETRTKFLKNTIGLQKDAPEAVGIFQIIRGMFLITIERDRFQHFVRLHSNLYFNRELAEVVHYLTIKIRDTLRLQHDHTLIALCRDNT